MKQFFFAQKAFITNEGNLLLVKKSADDPYHPNEWEVPGGRMDFGEKVEEHIAREVMEEVGIEIEAGKPFAIWTWQMHKVNALGESVASQVVAVARLCVPKSLNIDTQHRVDDDFLAETEWVPFSKVLQYNLIPDMIPVVKAFLEEKGIQI